MTKIINAPRNHYSYTRTVDGYRWELSDDCWVEPGLVHYILRATKRCERSSNTNRPYFKYAAPKLWFDSPYERLAFIEKCSARQWVELCDKTPTTTGDRP